MSKLVKVELILWLRAAESMTVHHNMFKLSLN